METCREIKTIKLAQVRDFLEAEVIAGEASLHLEVEMACGSDLMSDVLAFTKPGSLLLTGLTNPQVIRTVEVAEIRAVCFVRGKAPPAETVELAKEKGIPLLCTKLPMYESCGRLYREGLPGCSEVVEEQ